MYLDLFWGCHGVISGLGGADLLRTALPRAGGLLDQDNFTLEAIDVISAEVRAWLAEKNKK